MMEATLPRSWREQFAFAAAMREEDIHHREKLARVGARQRQITEEQRIAGEKRQADARAMVEAALASPARIAQFHARLDTYDAKTVEFLMENGKALEEVRERIKRTLDQAHRLPDGRRVFKTEDGQHVFDEYGAQLGEDAIVPGMIPDHKVPWEVYKADRNEERQRAQQQEQALTFQEKLDNARDRLGKDGLTEAELTKMEADLRGAMPDAVRAKVEPDRPKAEVAPTTPSTPDGMEAMMRQTGLGPSPMAGPR